MWPFKPKKEKFVSLALSNKDKNMQSIITVLKVSPALADKFLLDFEACILKNEKRDGVITDLDLHGLDVYKGFLLGRYVEKNAFSQTRLAREAFDELKHELERYGVKVSVEEVGANGKLCKERPDYVG